ncbi:hypothetical protein [Polyangium mundeleinium]|uniref:VWFA domain-containing protein n=1 Tax=Polyangium mundeleinium TaxID=2995306 RepID=A0ABT5EZF1_9BACT|nr:hypothetical protein [Polyangium mundeleinium]MDC0747208.1 hypothetical protein [Polyangium mundeleinium]
MGRVLRWLGVSLGLFVSIGIGLGGGCAAGGSNRPGSGGDGGEGGSGGSGNHGPVGPGGGGGGGIGGGGGGIGGGGGGGGPACAKFTAEATQAPATMLTVLDASASMNKSSKWGTAQLAIKSAIDKDVFDTMSLGLTVFPASFTDPSACLCTAVGSPGDIATCKLLQLVTGAPGVSCGFSFPPQVPMAPAGTEKSTAPTGVRRQMYDWLVSHSPLSNADDGSPIYDALQAGYAALKAENIDRRMLVLITDGGFSCTSVASPARAGYMDLNGCPDWEMPKSVNDLITAARTDPTKPIFTFIVGVPGSNSAGAKVDGFDTPPYNMLLALSTYAVSGSPDTVDPSCDKGAVFTLGAPAPAKPCHIDLSNGAQFNADALAKAIADVRGKALGCVYDLPLPPPGEQIDKTQVNVNLTLDGMLQNLKKRTDPLDLCPQDGCWDYTPDGKVQLLGKACEGLGAATDAKVDIQVGCETILK